MCARKMEGLLFAFHGKKEEPSLTTQKQFFSDFSAPIYVQKFIGMDDSWSVIMI